MRLVNSLISLILISVTVIFGITLNVPGDYSTIQEAINSSNHGDTILVQPGTYVENINFNGKNIVVSSLYSTTGNTSYISKTVVDGNQKGIVVKFMGGEDSTAELNGFTITNGYTFGGGGGIFCWANSNPSLKNLIISRNTALEGGGGIYCGLSHPGLNNVIISENASAFSGGGVHLVSSHPRLKNVTIYENTAPSGGAMYCAFSNPILENVIICGNTARYNSGGIRCNSSNPILMNVTISGNKAPQGAGIHCFENSNPSIENSILWNNTPKQIYFAEIGDQNSITITYSDVQGGKGDIDISNGSLNWLKGNIDFDPHFVNDEQGNYHLNEDSPCINSGNPASDYRDADGSRNNMGAYGGPNGNW